MSEEEKEMKLKINGQATLMDESVFNEQVQNETIIVEVGDEIVSDGPLSIEVVEK